MRRRAALGGSELQEWLEHQAIETYNDRVVRQFAVASVVWGVLASALVVLLALQRCWPALNLGFAWLSYGQLRPLQTNALVYAFAGSALLAGAYYCVQRTCHVRLFANRLAGFTFWGWQGALLAAAATQLLGIIRGATEAALEAPVDLLIALVWVAGAFVCLSTIARRRVRRIHVANWFFAAFVAVLAVQQLLNSLAASLHLAKSYVASADSIGEVMQWWSGHNTEGFFLTAGFFGMLYYFVPRQAGHPVYSRRLAVLQLWALIAVYVWSGPYDLHYDSLPGWVQSTGIVFSLLLIVAAWAGMLNGFMTLSGAWERLRADPILRFMIVSLCLYGLASFQGPLMSIKPPNGLPQYAGWLLGHLHSGGLSWVALMSIGALYALIPPLFGRARMFSPRLIETHLWLATSGVLIFIAALWIADIRQRALIEDGVSALGLADGGTPLPFRLARLLGGVLYFGGLAVMAYNVWLTIRGAEPVALPVTAPEPEQDRRQATPSPQQILSGRRASDRRPDPAT